MRHDRHLRAEAFCADFTPAAALDSLERNPPSIGDLSEPRVKEFATAIYRGMQVLLRAADLATAGTQRAFAQISRLGPTRRLIRSLQLIGKKRALRISRSAHRVAARARRRGRPLPWLSSTRSPRKPEKFLPIGKTPAG